MSSKTTLPPTVQKLPLSLRDKFKTLCDHHERQEWKKSLKSANEILSEAPNQPDTLSMKGLVLLSAPEKEGGNKAEGVNLLKQALTYSKFTSYICWHAYGLYYKGEKQYDETIKCYNRALKLYPENITILRDLAYLQAQTKDFAGLFNTRKQILKLRSDIDFYWFSTAMAAYLNDEYEVALRLSETGIRHYRTSFKCALDKYDEKEELKRKDVNARTNLWLQHKAEMNGLHMFRVMVFTKMEKYDEALKELDEAGSEITDKLGAREARASILAKMGRKEDALKVYDELLRINPDSIKYHQEKMGVLGIEPGTPDKIIEYVDKVAAAEAKSVFCQLFRLSEYNKYASEADFRAKFADFVWAQIQRGIPSIYQAIKRPLLKGENGERNVKMAVEIVHDIISKCKAEGKNLPPTDLLWSLHFGSQVLSAAGQHEEAKTLIDEAISHTPTLLDLYTAKARILRHAGDDQGASEAYETARSMDKADRYLANRSAKYLMKVGETDKAREIVALFLKAEDGSPDVVLANYQCIWYEYCMANSFLAKKEYGMSLKKFVAIVDNYIEYKEAQFDFHYYAFRKCNLVEYLNMLKHADEMPQFDKFATSLINALNIYSEIADLDKEEIKKKIEERKETTASTTTTTTTITTNHMGRRKRTALPADKDPLGDKLLQAEDPLGDAIKLYKKAMDSFRDINRADVHVAAAKVAIKKGDKEMAKAAVERIKKIDPENKELSELTNKLA